MSKKIKSDSFFHRRLQQFIANTLFPTGKGDWYASKGYGQKAEKNAFTDFIQTQKTDSKAQYNKNFTGLDFELSMVPSKLSNEKPCELEVLKCKPSPAAVIKPGTGKHIIYFPGANTYYQACFRDISTACKETGATIHAFNFPGTGRSTGKVKEANDLTNAGIAVVLSLLKQGISPDDIILQGDCYGAGIALEVKKQFEKQSGIKLRIIMNNAFKSFKAAINDMLVDYKTRSIMTDPFKRNLYNTFTKLPWLANKLKNIVKTLLEFTGWHVTPGKKYIEADPYQCHIQHLDDQTLKTSTLSGKVARYKNEILTGETNSSKRAAVQDPCPEEYRVDRDELNSKHLMRVKEKSKKRLGEKFGHDPYGRVNSHFADLCELEMLNGKSVYEGFVNEFIQKSDNYIAKHPQRIEASQHIHFLAEADSLEITQLEAQQIQTVSNWIAQEQAIRIEPQMKQKNWEDLDLTYNCQPPRLPL